MNVRIYALAVLIVQGVVSANATLHIVTSLANSGPGSLRDEVAASIAGDTIQFTVNGTIVLNSAIIINKTLFVQGPGPSKLIVSGNSVGRVFGTSGNPVFLSGMTIRDGLLVAQPGTDGVFCEDGGAGGDAYGGAIIAGVNFNDVLIVSNCWLTANTARGGRGGHGSDNSFPIACAPGKGGAGGVAAGGALHLFNGTAVAINCTFSDNHAIGGQGGLGGNNVNGAVNFAGGIGGAGGTGRSGGADLVKVFNTCTFSGNSAIGGMGSDGGTNAGPFSGGNGGDGGDGTCGAIQTAFFEMVSCTIVSNTAVAGTGGAGGSGSPSGNNGVSGQGFAGGVCGYTISCGGGPMIGNTILADNYASTSRSNAFMQFNDQGFNYFGDDDFLPIICAVPTTRIGTVPSPLHPQLAPLAQNGGGLPTHAPLQGSPVIDWGYSFGTTTDERRAPRPYGSPAIIGGDGSDVGAFEFGSTPLGVSIGGTNGTNVVITWPAYYGDFTLQSTTNLLSPQSWITVPETPVEVGDQFTVTNSTIGQARFYRLSKR